MPRPDDRRETPRLRLSYPIVLREQAGEEEPRRTNVTWNVSASGAYFGTFEATRYGVGARFDVLITVPHRPTSGGPEVVLGMRAAGSVVRVDGPTSHRRYGEDGLPLAGVAVRFDEPLDFRYGWA